MKAALTIDSANGLTVTTEPYITTTGQWTRLSIAGVATTLCDEERHTLINFLKSIPDREA